MFCTSRNKWRNSVEFEIACNPRFLAINCFVYAKINRSMQSPSAYPAHFIARFCFNFASFIFIALKDFARHRYNNYCRY